MTRTQIERMKTEAERAFRNPREAAVRYDARDAMELFDYVAKLERELRNVVAGDSVAENFQSKIRSIARDIRFAAMDLEEMGGKVSLPTAADTLALIA